jgi:hypothetical protein
MKKLLGLAVFGTVSATSLVALADGAPCTASIAPGHSTAFPLVALSAIALGAVLSIVRTRK